MFDSLLEKNALVTPVFGGIGAEIARSCMHRGATVACSGPPGIRNRWKALKAELCERGLCAAL